MIRTKYPDTLGFVFTLALAAVVIGIGLAAGWPDTTLGVLALGAIGIGVLVREALIEQAP